MRDKSFFFFFLLKDYDVKKCCIVIFGYWSELREDQTELIESPEQKMPTNRNYDQIACQILQISQNC